MFDQTALRGFMNSLTVATEGLNAEAARAALVATAAAARDRVLGGTPKPSGYRQVVDGAEGAPLEAVRPDGYILFAWQYLGVVVSDTYGALVNASPRDKGKYIAGIRVVVDGAFVDPDDIPPDAAEATIVATVPYARRLEVGRRRDGSFFSIEKGPHIVEQTAIVARRLWGSLASFDFGYVDLAEAHVLTAAGRVRRHWRGGAWHRGSVRRRFGAVESTVRNPAIIIRARTA